MKKLTFAMSLLLCTFTMYGQYGSGIENRQRAAFNRNACYLYHDNRLHVISTQSEVIEENIRFKDYVVIKTKDSNWNFKPASNSIYEITSNGSFGDHIDIYQAWNDKDHNSKIVESPTKYFGANCQFTMLDSTHAIFTTKLYTKEFKNNQEYVGHHPMLFIFKYDYKTKYWTVINKLTFTQKQYEILVIKKFKNNEYTVQNSVESCNIKITNNKIEIINN